MSEVKVNKISPRTNCGTVQLGDSGDTITIPAGATITNNGTQTGFGRTGTVNWDTTAKTTGFTAVSGNGYFVNTTSGAITVTLPASPSAGDIVSLSDYAGTWDNNSCTVARNGSNINGAASDLVRSADRGFVTLIYVDGTQGWVTTDQSGTEPEFIIATGGTITTCGNYKIHTFTGPGTFTVCTVGNPVGSDTVDYLVVAGGGGGAADIGGGGGAGGLRFASSTFCIPAPVAPTAGTALPVTATGYPITVGGGGNGTTPGSANACSGSNSTFSTITSAGGGGAGKLQTTGLNGGSGGGAGGNNSTAGPFAGGTGNTPPVSPSQGNDGGIGLGGVPAPVQGPNTDGAGAGGGGHLAAGTNGGPTFAPSPAYAAGGGGNGGGGFTFPANSFQTCATAYAGGGGGGGYPNPACNVRPAGAGGSGGGGAGGFAISGPGTAGTTNRGGGGGGGAGSNGNGANGGSGIVIIRYKYQ
jgi:hypothetical protein